MWGKKAKTNNHFIVAITHFIFKINKIKKSCAKKIRKEKKQ